MIQERYQSVGGSLAAFPFGTAFRIGDLGCIDIGDADLFAVEPDRVAINHTSYPLAFSATLPVAVEVLRRYGCFDGIDLEDWHIFADDFHRIR
ncbi:MAG: hypothetical protein BGO05_19170 [Rhizobiales bacterium 63-7]|nr:MAG: hypothetical protein BGO05_19170 [Rhizobiales bacterium 63-7]